MTKDIMMLDHEKKMHAKINILPDRFYYLSELVTLSRNIRILV